jgi:hypothetical protein
MNINPLVVNSQVAQDDDLYNGEVAVDNASEAV